MPRLLDHSATRPRSYTFVSGGSNSMKGLAQINSQAMCGLSAALQHEVKKVTVAELRVQLEIDRDPEKQRADPRERPLSHELGALVAGIAVSPVGAAAGIHTLATAADVSALRARLPALDEPYAQQREAAPPAVHVDRERGAIRKERAAGAVVTAGGDHTPVPRLAAGRNERRLPHKQRPGGPPHD